VKRIGILGAGWIATSHLQAIERHRGAKAVHIADMRLDVARKLAKRFGVARVSKDPAAVIADDEVDTVIIALPTFLHCEWLVRSAKAGKDILSEKPLCRTVAEACRALRILARHKTRLAVGYMRRFSPARVKVREIVQSGKLGRPVTWTIRSMGRRVDFGRGKDNWMWKRAHGGGLAMDGSIHDFDFAAWTLGLPVEMYAQSSCISPKATAPTQASAIVRFEQGDRVVYNAAWPEGDFGLSCGPDRIIGPDGAIALDSDYGFTWHYAAGKKRKCDWDADKLRPTGLGWGWFFYKQLDTFLRGEQDNPCLATGDEALASLWISEKIIEAGPEGKHFRFHGKG